jgi:hypothetical protein
MFTGEWRTFTLTFRDWEAAFYAMLGEKLAGLISRIRETNEPADTKRDA